MTAKATSTLLMTLALTAFSATAATAQHEGHAHKPDASRSSSQSRKAMSPDHMMMVNEPHHVLAMAYHENLATFSKALQEHSARASSVHVEFARAAVTEMRRSFDQMQQHHQEHMKTMSAEMLTTMSGMMQQMETHRTELNTQLVALEREVHSATPDTKRVATLAAGVHTHVDAMSKMRHDSKKGMTKTKM